MKGVCLLPVSYQPRWTDSYKILTMMMMKGMGFEGAYVSGDIPDKLVKDMDFVYTYAMPIHSEEIISKQRVDRLCGLPATTKIICHLPDLQSYDRLLARQNMNTMLERADLILPQCWEFFISNYPQHAKKAFYFPNFIAPTHRYDNLPLERDVKRACLMSGALNADVYELREHIAQFIQNFPDQNMIEHVFPPYWNQHTFIQDEYAKLLNSYFCNVTCSSKFNYVVAKYMEIPAAKSLLIANATMDSMLCGFVPGEHFVEVNQDNVIDTIRFVLQNFSHENYQNIISQGNELVMQNHTVDHRYLELQTLMEAF